MRVPTHLETELLRAEIEASKGNLDEAIRIMTLAVQRQEELGYMEPPSWHYQVRLSLGVLLLDAGKFEEAEAVYREALKKFRENGWALFGLLQSVRAQGKTKEAREVETRFRRAWALADVVLTSTRF